MFNKILVGAIARNEHLSFAMVAGAIIFGGFMLRYLDALRTERAEAFRRGNAKK